MSVKKVIWRKTIDGTEVEIGVDEEQYILTAEYRRTYHVNIVSCLIELRSYLERKHLITADKEFSSIKELIAEIKAYQEKLKQELNDLGV